MKPEEPPQPGHGGVPGSRAALVGRPPDGVRQRDLERLVARLVARLGRPDATVGVRFACDRTVRRYNRAYRGVDRATDVLSFPLADAAADAAAGGGFLGDLLISRERVGVQARRAGWSNRRETEELVIHGVLHLLGHDHETDAGEMDELELRLRRQLLDAAGAEASP